MGIALNKSTSSRSFIEKAHETIQAGNNRELIKLLKKVQKKKRGTLLA